MIQRMLRADYICIILNFRFISHEIKKQNAITVNGKFKKFENSKKNEVHSIVWVWARG